MKITKIWLAEKLAALREIYRQPPLSSSAFEMYYESLKNAEIEQIDEAIRLHHEELTRGAFMPTPYDFLSQLKKMEGNKNVHNCAISRPYQCQNPPKIEHEGAWYCWTHDPKPFNPVPESVKQSVRKLFNN